MAIARAALLAAAAAALALALVSGGTEAGPRTPPALAGLPPPFLGTAVSGDGRLTAALDAYGDVVDLRAPGPAGRALIANPAARQAAGTVAADTGIVPRLRLGGGPALPLWRADAVAQRYLRGTNVVETVASVRGARLVVRTAAAGEWLAMELTARTGGEGRAAAGVSGAGAGGRAVAGVSGGEGRAVPVSGAEERAAAVSGAEEPAAPVSGGEERAVPAVSGAEGRAVPAVSVNVGDGIECAQAARAGALDLLCRVGRALPPGVRGDARELFRECERVLGGAVAAGRRWGARARPLGSGAPAWAERMYGRSLLVLRALTDRRTGAVAAGARDGWAYVWPRDAAAAALAYAAAGYGGGARRVAGFLAELEVGRAARFDGEGAPVAGRGPQGDAAGWIAAAADAAGLPAPAPTGTWRDLPDYQEGRPGAFLGNALAAASARDAAHAPRPSGLGGADGPKAGPGFTESAHRPGGRMERRPGFTESAHRPGGRMERWVAAAFGTPAGLVREAGDPSSGLDSAAAWAVRPFSSPGLRRAARRTLLRLAAGATPYGITPGAGWQGGADPWSAPTAWSAWSLAALGERAAALRLLGDLRRAATPAGALPERVDARTGVPRSTTPLAWSHAFAVLALRQLWPPSP